MPSRRGIAAILLALLGLVAASCRGPGAANVATVNGVGIPRELLERVITTQLSNASDDSSPIPQLDDAENVANTERTFLTLFIRVEIVKQLADELGVLVSESDIDERWNLDISAREGGEEELLEFIDSLGLTVEEYRHFELANAARIEAIEEEVGGDVEITDAMIEEAYSQREWDRARASHILVETEEEAIDLKQQLDDGADFAELAEEHSTDPGSAALGGDLGVQPRGVYVPEFEDYIWSAPLDELSDPIQTDFGWHLIIVTERESLTLEDAADGLRSELESSQRAQVVQARFREAIDAADVVVDSRIGRWDPVETAVVPLEELTPDPAAPTAPGLPTDLPIPEVTPSP